MAKQRLPGRLVLYIFLYKIISFIAHVHVKQFLIRFNELH
jgi:hypothetical protein